MKRSDFVRLMGNIDEKYLKEADNYSARPRNWVRVTAVAACLSIIVTAIPAALILNREDVNTDSPVLTTNFNGEDNDVDKKFVQIIYCDAKSAAQIKKASQNKDIEIKDISEIETELSTKVGDIEASAEIPARLYKTISGKDYIFNFSSAYSTTLTTSSNEQLKKHGSVAIYGIEGKALGEARMEYCYETEKVIYLRLQSNSTTTDGDYTLEQTVVLSERDLATLYGDDFAQTYALEFSELTKAPYNCYTVRYRRMVCGYPTDEAITINYSTSGELISVVTNNLGSFDHIDKTLSIEKIKKAEAEALEILGDTKIEQTYLTVDKEGNVYVYVAYTEEYTFQLYYAIDGSVAKPRVD